MLDYQHILVSIDCSVQSDAVVAKALALAETYQAKLSMIHVLDNIPMPDTSYGTVISLLEDSENTLLAEEKATFRQYAAKFGIQDEQCWLVWGVPKEEIVRLANKEQIDLIVVGSHGRHGLALLLGSSANSVLHHAQCDVLAVRLQESGK